MTRLRKSSVRLDEPVRYRALPFTQPMVALNYTSAVINSEYFFVYISILLPFFIFGNFSHYSSSIIPVANLCAK